MNGLSLRGDAQTGLRSKGSGGQDLGKIISRQDLIPECRTRRNNGEKVVFAAGRFDFLHPGHVRLLEQARDYGEILVVAVWNDAGGVSSPPRRPGEASLEPSDAQQRTFTPAAERAEILAALAAVDYAIEVAVEELPGLLTELRPDIVVEGAEQSSATALARAGEGAGAAVVRIPLEPGHSTAGIIERIVQLSGSE